jgi:hypothetical protein
MMRMPWRDFRAEHRLKQRERLDAAPALAKQFPDLKKLLVNLEYYEATGNTRNGEMMLNVYASAITARRKSLTGELRCQGTRKRSTHEGVPCQTLLRYKLNLDYD